MEWQPIETAPKDGTWVIGHHGDWDVPAASVMWQMDYRHRREMWTFGDGDCPAPEPTHWITVPPLPSKGQ